MRRTRLPALIGLLLASVVLYGEAQAPTPNPTPAVKSSPRGTEAEIRQVYDRWAKAFRAHDVDAIMSVYAPGDALVAFDIVPPLQYVGKDAYRKDYEEFLAQYEGPIETEFRDLRIVVGDGVAFFHCLEKMSGTLKNGEKSEVWIRATSGLRKIKGKWLIVHDHISAPIDLNSGKAVLDLQP